MLLVMMADLCRTTGSTFAIALCVIGPVAAHAQTGTVVGTVYDSIAYVTLPDAAVFLWDTPYRGVSDADGRFRIENVPVGNYSVIFFHRRLGELGVSPGPQPVVVRAGRDADVPLATPSRSTLITSQCLLEDRPEGSGAIAGRISDGGSDLHLGGSSVTLSWDVPGSASPGTIHMRTASDGWYSSCAAPANVPILLSATFIGRAGLRREVTVAENDFTEAPLSLFPLRPSRIAGHLVDATSRQDVRDATAWLRGTTFRTLSDSNGHFVFDDVPPGTYMLMTDHLAYGTKMDTLVVPDETRLQVEMRLDTRPIEIAPITVTTEAARPELDRVRGGILITRQQIDEVRQRARDASDIIRSLALPGVIVKHMTNGTICVGYITGQVKMNQTGCVEMVIFINDVRATDISAAAQMDPGAIERMVVYKPIDAGTLFGLGGGNGVWMIYTRGN